MHFLLVGFVGLMITDIDAPLVTIKLHHGGEFVKFPRTYYAGGCETVYDNVDLKDISLKYIDLLCEKEALMGYKRYSMKWKYGFRMMMKDKELFYFYIKFASSREIHTYVDAEFVMV